MTMRAKGLSAGLVLGALVALGAMMSGGAAASPSAGAAKIPGCTEANNVEAVIDDSGSMGGTDPSRLRASLLETLVGLPDNQGTQLGAVEFASEATVLFSPLPIGTKSAQTTVGGFLGLIDADGSQHADDFGGSTNYNAGFTAGNLANPGADARIFLSDGLSNDGGDPSVYRTPPTKTFVAGFDAAVGAGSTLGLIASETNGVARPVGTSAEILPLAGEITGWLNCEEVQTLVHVFNSRGQRLSHKFKATGKTAQILTTWPAELTRIALGIKRIGGGKAGKASTTVASASGKGKRKRGVKGKRSKGANYSAIKAKGLKKGKKYRIQLKAKALPVPGTIVTTQVID